MLLMLPDICFTWSSSTRADSLSDLRARWVYLWVNWKLHDLNEAALCNNSFLFLVWHVIELQRGMHLQQVPPNTVQAWGPPCPPSVTSLCSKALSLPGKPDSSSDTGTRCCCRCWESSLVKPWELQRCPADGFESVYYKFVLACLRTSSCSSSTIFSISRVHEVTL